MPPVDRRARRIGFAAALLGGGVLAGTAGLVVVALRGADAAESERHREVADRLFDEIERELSALVEREEARSFLEYRFFYQSEDNALDPALLQSPLSRPSEDPAIVGWFQLDPDGTLHTPAVPRGNERSLAEQQGWSVGGTVALEDSLGRVVRSLPGVPLAATPQIQQKASSAKPSQKLAPPQEDEPQTKRDLFNRAADKRLDRKTQLLSVNSTNFDAYNPSGQDIEQMVKEQAAQAPSTFQEVAVEVTPIDGVRAGDHLVLQRTVRTAAGDQRQGLVLVVDALAEQLERTVLSGSGLRPYVTLAWDGAPAPEAAHVLTHRFEEPFTSLVVTAALSQVPDLVGSDARNVRLLAVALLLAVVGGGLGLGRAVSARLEYAERRSDFVAAVSHELKTPLTTIRMYAEMLRDGMVPGADKQRAYHQTITAEAERLGRLIGNVLELAKLERGAAPSEPIVGAIEPVLRDAIEIVRPHAAQFGFEIVVLVEEGLPPVRMDRDALVQVVVNLVDNAVKFAADGHRTVEVALTNDDGRVALTVRDHGAGVPASQLGRVFEPFWRGERELTRRSRGTGIGLALVQGLVQQMGGEVVARNHPDGGFEVTSFLSVAVRS